MLKLEQVEKNFRETSLNYPTVEFIDRQSYLLIGASGTGKSTLLNMLAGMVSPSSGEVLLDGVNIEKMTRMEKENYRAKDIGYIFQDYKLIEDLTVEDNIRVMEVAGVKTRDLHNITRILGISDKLKRKVRTLSGGEKQRVAIARAMVKNPAIILADEPTGSLNGEMAGVVIKSLLDLSKKKLLIMATHDIRLAKKFDHVIDLSKGVIVC